MFRPLCSGSARHNAGNGGRTGDLRPPDGPSRTPARVQDGLAVKPHLTPRAPLPAAAVPAPPHRSILQWGRPARKSLGHGISCAPSPTFQEFGQPLIASCRLKQWGSKGPYSCKRAIRLEAARHIYARALPVFGLAHQIEAAYAFTIRSGCLSWKPSPGAARGHTWSDMPKLAAASCVYLLDRGTSATCRFLLSIRWTGCLSSGGC